jgi:hypothetical protein
MAGMPMKEVARIAKHVEAQGVNITRTKKGLLLRMPDGESAMMHFTTSDVNAIKNLRAQLHRSGVSLPNDRHDLTSVPAYARRNATKQSLTRVRAILKELDHPQIVKPAQVISLYNERYETHAGANATVMSALHKIGYYPALSPAQIKRGGDAKTVRQWERDLTAAELAELIPEAPVEEPKPEPVLRIVPDEPEPVPEPEAPAEPAAREFIDTADSWTVTLDALDQSLTVGQVLALYVATGLDVELRVWRPIH